MSMQGRELIRRCLQEGFEGEENVVVAFALVSAAGLTTAIGAAVVFSPHLARFAAKSVLAGTMAFSAGVMLYISLVDIYGKSVGGFEEEHEEGDAFIYATLCFFAGILMMFLVDRILIDTLLLHGKTMAATEEEAIEMGQEIAVVEEFLEEPRPRSSSSRRITMDTEQSSTLPPYNKNQSNVSEDETDPSTTIMGDAVDPSLQKDAKSLMKTGLATAVAIAIHNFPEGLITFVGYMSDPAIGIILCIGITLHNIPEGLCVAMPVYYASGSRWKGFLWGMISGLSEPLGALIGWAVLRSSMSGNTYGILFGLVAGMMTYICVDELFPTAIKYDPENKFTTILVFFGMLIIAASLMIFST